MPVLPDTVIHWFKSGHLKVHEKQPGRESGYLSREIINRIATEETSELLKWHYVRVIEINETTCESMCIAVKDVECFLQNGQDHSNSQGSTYNNVFIDIVDIGKNRKEKERNQLLYVGCSRAKENLIIMDRIL